MPERLTQRVGLIGREEEEGGKKEKTVRFLNPEHKEQFLRSPVCFIQSVTPPAREHSVRDGGAAD